MMCITKLSSIISWNAQGLSQSRSKWDQLQLVCDYHKPVAILIQDHRLKSNHKHTLKGYNIVYINYHLINIIREDVDIINLTQYNQSHSKKLYTSWTSVKLNYHNRRLLLCNTYNIPCTSTVLEERNVLAKFTANIQTASEQFDFSDIIVAGDFNAHSTHWSDKSTPKGEELVEQFSAINLVNLNHLYTHNQATHQFGAVLDLAWTDSIELIQDMHVDDDRHLISDHNALIINLNLSTLR